MEHTKTETKYNLEGHHVSCPACGSGGPLKVASSTNITLATVEGATLVELNGFTWDSAALTTCKCGFSGRMFLFRGERKAWVYVAEPGSIEEVDMYNGAAMDTVGHDDGVLRVLVKLPDELSECGSSNAALHPLKLHPNKLSALAEAEEHLQVLQTMAQAMVEDVSTRLGEVQHFINVEISPDETECPGEGGAE